MKLFYLNRVEDESGISGEGIVAQGVVFDNGWVAMAWLTDKWSLCFYPSVEFVEAIHGHNGKTQIVWAPA